MKATIVITEHDNGLVLHRDDGSGDPLETVVERRTDEKPQEPLIRAFEMIAEDLGFRMTLKPTLQPEPDRGSIAERESGD